MDRKGRWQARRAFLARQVMKDLLRACFELLGDQLALQTCRQGWKVHGNGLGRCRLELHTIISVWPIVECEICKRGKLRKEGRTAKQRTLSTTIAASPDLAGLQNPLPTQTGRSRATLPAILGKARAGVVLAHLHAGRTPTFLVPIRLLLNPPNHHGHSETHSAASMPCASPCTFRFRCPASCRPFNLHWPLLGFGGLHFPSISFSNPCVPTTRACCARATISFAPSPSPDLQSLCAPTRPR